MNTLKVLLLTVRYYSKTTVSDSNCALNKILLKNLHNHSVTAIFTEYSVYIYRIICRVLKNKVTELFCGNCKNRIVRNLHAKQLGLYALVRLSLVYVWEAMVWFLERGMSATLL
jgi:hypothetical protein